MKKIIVILAIIIVILLIFTIYKTVGLMNLYNQTNIEIETIKNGNDNIIESDNTNDNEEINSNVELSDNTNVSSNNSKIRNLKPNKTFDLEHIYYEPTDDNHDTSNKYYNEFFGDAIWTGLEYQFFASSELKPISSFTYSVDNLNNTDLNTCWSEGVDEDGIGETISFSAFGNWEGTKIFRENINEYHKAFIDKLREGIYSADSSLYAKLDDDDNKYHNYINSIAIINGYVKDDTTWKNNNRVKTLRLTLNDDVIYDLELDDSENLQVFEIDYKCPITKMIQGKLEILDVYNGEKYDDTCITYIDIKGGADCFDENGWQAR